MQRGLPRRGAIAGMLVGSSTTLIWKLSGLSKLVIYELVPAFIFATLAVIIVSLLTRRKNVPEGR